MLGKITVNEELVKKHAYYNNKFFARWAKMYDWEKYFLFPLRRKAAKFFNLAPQKKIIDVATGTGAQAYELAKLGLDVTGVDLSPEMLAQARKKLDPSLLLSFRQGDGTTMPFGDNSFDGASISLGLHDMPYEIGVRVLREIKRVTKRNGGILVVDYMEPKKHIVAKFTHPLIKLYETPMYLPFIERGLEKILMDAGLSISRETDFLGISQIIVALNRK